MEIQLDSTILMRMSKAQPMAIPYVITAPPAEGYTLAIAVANEGARVLMVCEKSLQPPQYQAFNEKMTVFEEPIDNPDGWNGLADVLLGRFDAIVFIAKPESGDDDRDCFAPQDEAIGLHLVARLYAAQKRLFLGPSGASLGDFPEIPLGVSVTKPTRSDAASLKNA